MYSIAMYGVARILAMLGHLVQPTIEYALGNITVGAWSAWSGNGASGGNEKETI